MNLIIWVALAFIGLIGIWGIRIVRPIERGLIETLGKYSKTSEPGFNWIIPIVQKMIKVNTTEIRVDVEPQYIITKDKLNAEVDAVVYFKIKDASKAIYNVNNFSTSVPSLARTTLRAIVGKMTLSEANENRDQINVDVEKELDRQTDAWGIDIVRVELQKIEPPQDVQEAMNGVVKAENKKIAAKDTATALETEADGQKRAAIKVAEGNRQAVILKAEGTKKSSILEAEGKAQAFKLVREQFKDEAQELKRLEVTEASLKHNAKIILTEKGINPTLLIGELPIK